MERSALLVEERRVLTRSAVRRVVVADDSVRLGAVVEIKIRRHPSGLRLDGDEPVVAAAAAGDHRPWDVGETTAGREAAEDCARTSHVQNGCAHGASVPDEPEFSVLLTNR